MGESRQGLEVREYGGNKAELVIGFFSTFFLFSFAFCFLFLCIVTLICFSFSVHYLGPIAGPRLPPLLYSIDNQTRKKKHKEKNNLDLLVQLSSLVTSPISGTPIHGFHRGPEEGHTLLLRRRLEYC